MLLGLIACTPSADKETQQSLATYTQFVDSVYAQNEAWKMYPDTDFVETPYDVNDPSKTRIDTIVTAADKKEKSIMLNAFFGKIILEKYEKVKAAVESKAAKMDEKMKKEFEESKQKFESLLIP